MKRINFVDYNSNLRRCPTGLGSEFWILCYRQRLGNVSLSNSSFRVQHLQNILINFAEFHDFYRVLIANAWTLFSGQSQPNPGQSSPWEFEPPSFTYASYPSESLYPGMDLHGLNSSTDQLHFQNQLLERLHNISPYQQQRSPYATPSPYTIGPPSFLLSPTNNKPSVSLEFLSIPI